MKSFKDTKGRTWLLTITVAAVKRAKSLTGVDLYTLPDDGLKPLAELMRDVVKLVDVLFVLARDPNGGPPTSDEDFAEGLAGDALGDASDAFVEALIDFFPRAGARKALTAVQSKAQQVREVMLRNAMKDLEKIDPEDLAQKILAGKASSGKSPADSE
jgi:hypothetical protein